MKTNLHKWPSDPIKNKNIEYPEDDKLAVPADLLGQGDKEGIFG